MVTTLAHRPVAVLLPVGRLPERHETPSDGRIAGGLKGDRAIPMGSQAHSAAHIGAPERSLMREACTRCDFGLAGETMVDTWWSRARANNPCGCGGHEPSGNEPWVAILRRSRLGTVPVDRTCRPEERRQVVTTSGSRSSSRQ
jgi:hypothetical protein